MTSNSLNSFLAHILLTKSERDVLSRGFVKKREESISISVILIHHDSTRLHFLIECITSIQNQIYGNFEVVVVTNYEFSPQVRDLIESLNVAKILFFKNSHPSQARNFGIQNVDSHLIAFVDDDNLLLPWHLLFIANSYKTHPDAAIYAGSYLCFESESITNFPLRYPLNRRTLVLGDPTDVSSIAMKRSSFPTIHWDDQVLSENWAFLIDAFEIGVHVRQISAPLSLHRNHLQSRSVILKRPLVPREWFEKYRKHISWGFDIPNSTRKARFLKTVSAFFGASDP